MTIPVLGVIVRRVIERRPEGNILRCFDVAEQEVFTAFVDNEEAEQWIANGAAEEKYPIG